MPKKVSIGFDEFRAFCARMYHEHQFGFVPKGERLQILMLYLIKLEQSKSGKKKKARPDQKGLQTVLKYENEKFIVYMFTTFVWEKGEMKGSDEGWVFIVDKRKPKEVCFYSFPLRRTKNYLATLEAYAAAEKNRIDSMPCCDECKTLLTVRLVKGKGQLHQYTLDCPNHTYFHRGRTTKLFYTGMDPVHQSFLESKFGRYTKYTKRNEAAGIIRTPNRFIRAKKTAPEPKGNHLVKEVVDAEANYDVPQ